MGNVRGRGCQSVINRAISNNFFVNCYSLFASINRLEYLKFFEVINGFLTLNEIAIYILLIRVNNKP